ncbi:MAG: hypothetical protein ACO1QS_07295 [Verrucomicrobiota bacterium]
MSTNAQDIKVSEFEGFERVSGIIAGRPLFHFSRVHAFRYFARREDELGDQWSDIELVMEEFDSPHAQIGIRFHRVADVSFSGFGQIMGLYFQRIQERGWEQLRFEVGDYEDGRIHLFCHEISVFDPGRAA